MCAIARNDWVFGFRYSTLDFSKPICHLCQFLVTFSPFSHRIARGDSMNSYLFTFKSITPAQRGEVALRRRGIDCTLGRTPRAIALRGCGYYLGVRSLELTRAASALQDANVPYQKIYRQEGQHWEEVSL